MISDVTKLPFCIPIYEQIISCNYIGPESASKLGSSISLLKDLSNLSINYRGCLIKKREVYKLGSDISFLKQLSILKIDL